MSDYLIREIDAAPNVGVGYRVQVVDGAGTGHLQSLVLQDTESGARREVPADALFVLIGSQPQAQWLGDRVARDQWGFILTGPDRPAAVRNWILIYYTSATGVVHRTVSSGSCSAFQRGAV